MKYIISAVGLCFLLIIMQSCTKENQKNILKNKPTETGITGEWELRNTSAAMLPGQVDYAPGNGNIIKFTSTGYEMYENGSLVRSGLYNVVPDTGVTESVCLVFSAGQFEERIVYDGTDAEPKIFFQITGNRLTFVSGCYALDGGHRSEYEKL